MAEAVGFGIIGCGWVARKHAEAIRATPGSILVAAMDQDPTRAEQLTRDFGGIAHADRGSFLAMPGLDVVIVATPNGMHLEHVEAAAAAGKAVIVEKPLDITLDKARAVVAAGGAAGVAMAACFPNRFNPQFRTLQQAICEGRLGRILLASASVRVERSAQYYKASPWRGAWETEGGGVLMTQAIHALDLLLWLTGGATSVFGHAETLKHQIATEDTAVAVLRLKSGGLATVAGSTATVPEMGQLIDIHGEFGMVQIHDDRIIRWLEHGQDLTPEAVPWDIWRDGFGGLIADVASHVRSGTPLAVPASEGFAPLELILSVYQSARTAQEIPLRGAP